MLFFLIACQSGEKGFQVTDTGLKYKFFEQNKDARKVQANYMIDFHIVRKDHKDSLLGDQSGIAPFPDDSVKGDPLLEALRLMAEGDSAIFLLSTDTLAAEQKKAIQGSIDALKQQMETQLSQAPDTVKENIQRQYEARLQQAEQQMGQMEKFLPPGKFLSFAIKINGVRKQEDMPEYEREKIDKYLKDNNLTAKTTESGLSYVIEKEGTGAIPKKGDTISVKYTGKLLNGTVFDTSVEEVAKSNNVFNPGRQYVPLRFPLGVQPMIKGWEEAMYLMKEGTVAKLLIPSQLGYGERGSGRQISPYATLLFEIELTKVEETPAKEEEEAPAKEEEAPTEN